MRKWRVTSIRIIENIAGKTTISIDEDLHKALREMGNMGDTYNDVIRRLLEKHGELEKK